jgi:hypothetical protein
MMKESDLFDRWKEGNTDAVGNPATPIKLLVLTALRYLGRGWTFDDLSESTAISEDVIRVFFHKFIEFGSTTLFNKFVMAPSTVEETEKQSHEYEMAGESAIRDETTSFGLQIKCYSTNLQPSCES